MRMEICQLSFIQLNLEGQCARRKMANLIIYLGQKRAGRRAVQRSILLAILSSGFTPPRAAR